MIMKIRNTLCQLKQASAGAIRVLLLLILSLSVVLSLLLREAVVVADDAMMDLGKHLIALSESGMGRNERGILLNGQEIGFRVFSTEQDMISVLDFYENWCRGGSGTFREQETTLLSLPKEKRSVSLLRDRSWTDLTRRDVDGEMGFIACIKHGLANPSVETLSNKLTRFALSGNLSDLGKFHYASVSRTPEGTRVVAVWTEDDFFPLAMFPEEGDAPGFAIANMQRPPSGRRMLSAGEIGNDETITIFVECEEPVDELADFYRRSFLVTGWRVLDDRETDTGHIFVVQGSSEMRVLAIDSDGEYRTLTIITAS